MVTTKFTHRQKDLIVDWVDDYHFWYSILYMSDRHYIKTIVYITKSDITGKPIVIEFRRYDYHENDRVNLNHIRDKWVKYKNRNR